MEMRNYCVKSTMEIKKLTTIEELEIVKKMLSKTNPSKKFRSTTKKLASLLKLSEYKTKKYINMLESEKFLVCLERPKSLGRGNWSKFQIEILEPVKPAMAKTIILKQNYSICERCPHNGRVGYFNKVENGVKTKCKSYFCTKLHENVTDIQTCKYLD